VQVKPRQKSEQADETNQKQREAIVVAHIPSIVYLSLSRNRPAVLDLFLRFATLAGLQYRIPQSLHVLRLLLLATHQHKLSSSYQLLDP